MSKAKQRETPLIYADSALYIDLIQRNPEVQRGTEQPRWMTAKALFDAVNDNRARLAASALIEAEVCCNGESRKDSDRVRSLLQGWFNAERTEWTDVDRFLARDAVRITREHSDKRDPGKHLGSADALHLAAAIRLKCNYLMTQDGGFPIGHDIEGVTVARPHQVWDPDLLDELVEIVNS